MVSLADRKRPVPIACMRQYRRYRWTWVPYMRGHSGPLKPMASLADVGQLVPAYAPVFLVGESIKSIHAILMKRVIGLRVL